MPTDGLLQVTSQAYAELQTAFDHYNAVLFDGAIPQCLITLQREKRSYGFFSQGQFAHRTEKTTTDEIALNPSYFSIVPLLEILQTLVHEMTHAWQFHHGKPGRRTYHNKQWAAKMEEVGLMPSATGRPGGARTGEHMNDYPIAEGKFMRATEALFATGFKVSWIDRYPPLRTPTHLIPLSDSNSLCNDIDGRDVMLIAQELRELSSLTAPRVDIDVNRSNRIKYRCPGCGANAWGKPRLRLLCGEDGCEGNALNATI